MQDDALLRGVPMITDAANRALGTKFTERQVGYQLERQRWPGFKVGKIWHARASAIVAVVNQLEAAATELALKRANTPK